MAKRYELWEEAWNLVADLFTSTHTRGRPRSSDRLMLDGVLWLLRSGAPWRDMPECFGPWRTVYHRFVAYVVSSGALKNLGLSWKNATWRTDLPNTRSQDENRVTLSYSIPML